MTLGLPQRLQYKTQNMKLPIMILKRTYIDANYNK